MRTSTMRVVVAALLGSGCLAPLRASNRSSAPAEMASARVPGTGEETLAGLRAAFEASGFRLQTRYGRAPNSVYVFGGLRGAPIKGDVYWGRSGRAPRNGATVQVGSVFYAYLKPTDDGQTELTLLGKPTVAGREVCDKEDRFWNLPCVEVETVKDWEGRGEMDGFAEADTVRAVLTDLAVHLPGGSAIATFQPPASLSAPPPTWVGCEWEYQTGSHFQHHYCPNGEKSVVEQLNEDLLTRPAFSRIGDGAVRGFDSVGGP